MVSIRINGKYVDEVMVIVRALRSAGLTQGVHFDFAYHRPTWDNMTGVDHDRYALFMFYEEKHATLFALKYAFENGVSNG